MKSQNEIKKEIEELEKELQFCINCSLEAGELDDMETWDASERGIRELEQKIKELKKSLN